MSEIKKYTHLYTGEIWYLEKPDGAYGHFCRMYDSETIVFDMQFMEELIDDSK